MVLAGVAAISFFAIWKTENDLTGRFVVELSRNLYFVGVALTYLLWIAMVKIREARLRIIQLVLSLGVFFSASAAVYGLRYLFPNHAILKAIPPLLGCWLPISWAYTFSRVPEEAQVAPARLATLYR